MFNFVGAKSSKNATTLLLGMLSCCMTFFGFTTNEEYLQYVYVQGLKLRAIAPRPSSKEVRSIWWYEYSGTFYPVQICPVSDSDKIFMPDLTKDGWTLVVPAGRTIGMPVNGALLKLGDDLLEDQLLKVPEDKKEWLPIEKLDLLKKLSESQVHKVKRRREILTDVYRNVLHKKQKVENEVEAYAKLLQQESNDERSKTLSEMQEFSAGRLSHHITSILNLLQEDKDEHVPVRIAALQTLQKLSSDVLAQHVSGVLERLSEDNDENVRIAALETLQKLPPGVLAHHVDAVLDRLNEDDDLVRRVALETLQKLDVDDLAKHVDAVLECLSEDNEDYVRYAALWTLQELSPDVLAKHVDTVLNLLNEDDDWLVRIALETLQKLDVDDLAKHVDAVLDRSSEDNDEKVRIAALETLQKLSPDVLAQHVDEVMQS